MKLDNILMSSKHESFKNYMSADVSITVSGSIPNGGKDFVIDIPFSRTGTIVDVYVSKEGSSTKRLVNYSSTLGEFVDVYLTAGIYLMYSAGNIRVTVGVNNTTGSAKTPSTQTFNLQAVIFDAPVPN